MRLDFVARRKRWEAQQARAAPKLDGAVDEDEEIEGSACDGQQHHTQTMSQGFDQQSWDQEREAEVVRQQEERELEALIALMEEEDSMREEEGMQHYGSDEEDYDSLFMDYVQSDEARDRPNVPTASHDQDDDAMDTSNG